MLKMEMIPVLLRMASKIDIRPMVKAFSDEGLLKGDETNKEQMATVVFTAAATLLPQLGMVGDDLIELVAANRDVHIQEAKKLDAIKELKALLEDTGVVTFFSKLLMPGGEQKSLASLLSTIGK